MLQGQWLLGKSSQVSSYFHPGEACPIQKIGEVMPPAVKSTLLAEVLWFALTTVYGMPALVLMCVHASCLYFVSYLYLYSNCSGGATGISKGITW